MITTATDHVTAAFDGVLVALLLVLLGHVAAATALATGLIVSVGMLLTFAAHRRHLRSLQPRARCSPARAPASPPWTPQRTV